MGLIECRYFLSSPIFSSLPDSINPPLPLTGVSLLCHTCQVTSEHIACLSLESHDSSGRLYIVSIVSATPSFLLALSCFLACLPAPFWMPSEDTSCCLLLGLLFSLGCPPLLLFLFSFFLPDISCFSS